MTEATFDDIESALAEFKKGNFLLVLDDENRENEGDLIASAEDMTPERMAFLVNHSSGYVCVPLSNERADQLDLPLMIPSMQDRHKTAYTVTCDAFEGTTTGISAHDRAFTANRLADPTSKPTTFNRPGHVLPLRARDGGVLTRTGHTEASIELCRLTGKQPAAVICELVKKDGSMARRDDCLEFGKVHGVKVITIADLVKYVSK